MRLHLSTATAFLLLAAPALAQEAEGISSPLLSACIAGAQLDAEPTEIDYRAIALDGRPWLKITDDSRKSGSVTFNVQLYGAGTWWQRDGRTAPFRYFCQLERPGRTVKLHTRIVAPSDADALPPHRLVAGTAKFAREPDGTGAYELRVQLLDLSSPARPEILAEQVVRSTVAGPMPFALRLSPDVSPGGRKLAISAMLAREGQVRRRLGQPKPVGDADFKAPISLVLE